VTTTGSGDEQTAQAAIAEARARKVRQIAALEHSVATIFEAVELTSTDDEHDPEGATIAYERAQLLALLRQARTDLEMLEETTRRLELGEGTRCLHCGGPIGTERLLALPTTRTCVSCAS
jgi:RNA polymerase-binding transcription factor DksA